MAIGDMAFMTTTADRSHRAVQAIASAVQRLHRRREGAFLMEVLIAVFIFSLVGVATLVGYATTQRTGAKLDVQAQVENIGRNQMEYVFDQAFIPPGSASAYDLISMPPDFGASVANTETLTGETTIARIAVTVTYQGNVRWVLDTIRSNQ